MIVYLQILVVWCCKQKKKPSRLSLKGVKSTRQTNTQLFTHRYARKYMHICVTHTHTESHAETQKQHASLQDEWKRFIFRLLDPLLCSGFTERMKELPCPMLAFVCGGWGFHCGPKQGACARVQVSAKMESNKGECLYTVQEKKYSLLLNSYIQFLKVSANSCCILFACISLI